MSDVDLGPQQKRKGRMLSITFIPSGASNNNTPRGIWFENITKNKINISTYKIISDLQPTEILNC